MFVTTRKHMPTSHLRSLIDPAVLLDPYPALALLREHDPVHWSDDVRAWIVTRYADVIPLLRDPRLSANRVPVMAQQMLGGADTTPIRDYLRLTNDMMLMKDGNDHHRLRVLGNRGFTPTALAAWESRVTRVIDGLLDVIHEGRFDLVADLAEPMPATVIAEMFDIPKADHGKFRRWADDNARFFGGTVRDPLADGIAANDGSKELEAYFLRLHADRRQNPGDDLMSLFLAAEEAGQLTIAEVVNQCLLILVAGHVTTIDQLSNGIYALLSRPGEWERLARSPDLVPSAVEEMIRYDSAVTLVIRVAAADLSVGGQEIRAGQLVFLALAAANHDPAVFPNPERFDVTRSPNRHVGFGAGPHLCLGMNLVRMELVTTLRALMARYPNLRLDPDRPAERKCESLTFRGFARLPVLCG
jgi:cytochrome P450